MRTPLGIPEQGRGTWPGAGTPEQAHGYLAVHHMWGHVACHRDTWLGSGGHDQALGHVAWHEDTWVGMWR